jgi:predicted extracellular nuclease
MQKTLLLLAIITLNLSCSMQQSQAQSEYRVAFYNVENLFDTIDDPNRQDDEFLPGSELRWNSDRYRRKLDHCVEVFSALQTKTTGMPLLIGLGEVENAGTLQDLISHPGLKSRYAYEHYDSEDERGIDVALLYRPDFFIVISSELLRVDLGPNDQTRGVLYVKGLFHGRDTLHVFVNHWPSRREGVKLSEPNRLAAAATLRARVDEIMSSNARANIIIMGDFNDEPGNASITHVLKAAVPKGVISNDTLYNLSNKEFSEGKGTYYFKPESDWMMFDQLIVSGTMLNGSSGVQTMGHNAHVFSAHFLMYHQQGVGDIPNRTYGGTKYFGGYSDHLPVYFDFITK